MSSTGHALGRPVGRYEILRELGRGGMAVVHLARQLDLGRLVALKELAGLHASDPQSARRFLQEARVAAGLLHPNVVTVFDFFADGGTPFIAMELVERGNLRPYLRRMTLPQIGGVLDGVLAGLAEGERQGIVHRDLKPENLMVTHDGRIKVADYGIAKATSRVTTAGVRTATGMTVGTPGYMAPEQAMGQKIGPWTDLYALGCVAYELVVGDVPFGDADSPMAVLIRHINEPLPPVATVAPDTPPALAEWIDRLLAKRPQARPACAAIAAESLESLLIDILGPRWRRLAPLPDPPTPDSPRAGLADGRHSAIAPMPGPYTPPPSPAAGYATYTGASPPEPAPSSPPEPAPPSPAATLPASPTPPPRAATPPASPAPPSPAATAAESSPEPAPPSPAATAPLSRLATPPLSPGALAPPARRGGARRRGTLAIAAIGVLALAVAVPLVAHGSGGHAHAAAPARTPPPAPRALQLSAGAASVRLAGGGHVAAWPAGTGLALRRAEAAAPGGSTGLDRVVVGLEGRGAENPGLVPPQLATRPPARVKLGAFPAYRYSDLHPGGRNDTLTVFAAPTSLGVVAVACLGAPPIKACARIAASLSVAGAKPFPVGPDRTLAHAVSAAIAQIDRARARPHATSAPAIASALSAVAAAYRTAAGTLSARQISPADRGLRTRLAGALIRAQRRYAAAAGDARHTDRAAYAAATGRVRQAEARVRGALHAFVAAGYDSLRRATLAPRSLPALPEPPKRTVPAPQATITPSSSATPTVHAAPPPVRSGGQSRQPAQNKLPSGVTCC